MRQELVDVASGLGRKSSQDIPQVGIRIVPVELGVSPVDLLPIALDALQQPRAQFAQARSFEHGVFNGRDR